MTSVSEARDRLTKEDTNYRRLFAKHREYEDRLNELRSRKFLTHDEQIEEVKLKKLKLALKDEMEKIAVRSSC